jgi:hypothetical protein
MQPRSVTIQIDADDTQPFGLWKDQYVQFMDDGSIEPRDVDEVADAYIEAGVKVPVEFGDVRCVIENKINQLQAIL